MNIWLLAAAAMMLGFIPCGVICCRAPTIDRLVGMQLAGVVGVLTLILLARGYERPSYEDAALCVAILSYPGSLVYAHFMERWL